jgi:hypothetical protein
VASIVWRPKKVIAMPESLLFRLQEGKIKALREVVESWEAAHSDAILALDAEVFLAEGMELVQSMFRMWAVTWRDAEADLIDDYQQTGEWLVRIFDALLRVLALEIGMAERIARLTGHELKGQVELIQAVDRVRNLRDDIKATWPWPSEDHGPIDHAKIEASLEEYRRGEHDLIEDVIRGLQSPSPPVD